MLSRIFFDHRVLPSGFPSVLAKACARWGGPSLGHPPQFNLRYYHIDYFLSML